MPTVVVPPGTVDLSTVDPGAGTDPHAWYFYEGNQTITAGTDLSARVAQTSFYFGRHAPVTFSATLKTATTSTFISEAIGGLLNIMCDQTGGTDAFATFKLLGGMKVVDAGGGTWTNVEVASGELTLAEATALTNLDMSGGVVTVGYSATGVTSLKARGGTLYCRRGIASGGAVFLDGNAVAIFRRAQQIAASGIDASAGTTNFYLGGKAQLKWCGAAIDNVYLDSDDVVFDWQDMPAAATIGLVEGSAKAIARAGLKQGAVNTLRNGATLTVTAVNAKGGTIEQYAGSVFPAPMK